MKMFIWSLGVRGRSVAVGLLFALTLTTLFPLQPAQAQTEPAEAPKTKIFLAMVGFDSAGTPPQAASCEITAQASELAALLRSDGGQQRASLTCNQTLSNVAQQRAQDMADRGYFDHTTPDGYGPNYFVRSAGYPLPTFYNQANDGNNVESIGGGYASAAEAWAALKASAGHRRHLLGEEKFYAEQVEYGIGYVYSAQSTFKHYWVIITAQQAAVSE